MTVTINAGPGNCLLTILENGYRLWLIREDAIVYPDELDLKIDGLGTAFARLNEHKDKMKDQRA